MSRRSPTWLVVTASAVMLLTQACTPSSGADPAPGTQTPSTSAAGTAAGSSPTSGSGSAGPVMPTTVSWKACEAGSAGPDVDLSDFRCARVTAPLDWANPSGKTIELAVVKRPATRPSERLGTLFFNPGGPAGTGTKEFPSWYGLFPSQLRERFDLVSWDPRGVGESTAVQCFDNPSQLEALTGPLGEFPITAEKKTQWLSTYKEVARRCGERNGDLLAHVSTADTARDLEMLRRSIGDQPLNYLGVSYGTFLGATYANLFPGSIRSMVLDGNLSPDAWTNAGRPATASINTRIGSDRGVAGNLDAMLRLCGTAGRASCAFAADSAGATVAKWEELLTRLRKSPVKVGGGDSARFVTDTYLVDTIGSATFVVGPDGGAQGWSGAMKVVQTIWELSASPGPTPPAPPPAEDGTIAYDGPEQAWGVECGDAATPAPEAWPALAEAAEKDAGPSGADLVWGDYICSVWPTRAAQPYSGPWDADTSATILVVNNTDDPSTPYPNAVAMTKLLRKTRLITVSGYGHTSLLNPSTCVNDHEAAYMIEGTLPEDGARCAEDRKPYEEGS